MQPRPEKGCDEKDVKSKGGGQGLCRNSVDHIKSFDNDHAGHKTLRQEKVLLLGSLLSKFNVINGIPAQAFDVPFDFTSFSSQPFSGIGHNLFTAKVFIVGMLYYFWYKKQRMEQAFLILLKPTINYDWYSYISEGFVGGI